MNPHVFESDAGTWQGETTETAGRQDLRIWVAAGLVIVIALAFLLGFLSGHEPVPGLDRRQRALERQVQQAQRRELALLNSQHCQTDAPQIGQIERFLRTGQPQVAASLGNLYLDDTVHPACPQTRVQLGALVYTATMDGVFAQTSTAPLDARPLWTWRSAERRADAIGVPPDLRLSPLSVASQAYNGQMWPLARAAFLKAWQQQLVGPGDVEQVALYYAICRNQGLALLHHGGPLFRRQGVVMLRTADSISLRYELGRGEAHEDLVRALGTRVSSWPGPDARDPVLRGGRQS